MKYKIKPYIGNTNTNLQTQTLQNSILLSGVLYPTTAKINI